MSYTTAHIAEALGVTLRGVQKRAKKEKWTYSRQGRTRLFTLASLPEDVRAALAHSIAHQTLTTAETTALAQTQAAPVRRSNVAGPLDIPRKKKALARADLVRHYTHSVRVAANKAHARQAFMQAYHAGAWPELLQQLGPTSWKTLERWKVTVQRSGDAFSLADQRGLSTRGQSSLTDGMQQAVLRLALHPNRVRLSTCITMTRNMLTAHGQAVPSEATFRRFLTTFQERNQDVWVFCREGVKAWNDKVAMYVDRDLGRLWPGAVLVADGHRLNFQIIHPFTGRPCRMTLVMWYDMASNYPVGWEIAPEENTLVIAAAMRRALLRLGKPAQVAYLDNGRAFKGTHFTGDLSQSGVEGLFARLGMKTTFAWAYHGQSKTVERFFGYLKQLEELMPGGTGSCIDLKPAYQKRGEFAHRKIWESSGSPVMTLVEAHQAIAGWVDYYVQQPQPRSHLQGRCPAEVFDAGRGDGLSQEHLENLRECMLTARTRQVARCQLTLPGSMIGSSTAITYFDAALYGRKHDVVVKYDPQDLSCVDVYEQSGEFICTAAVKGTVHPMAKVLGSEQDQRLLKASLEMRKHAEKMATATATELLTGEIMPGYQASLERMGLLKAHTAELPAAPAPVLPGPGMTDEEWAERMAELETLNTDQPVDAGPDDDFEPYSISPAEQFWMDVRGTWPEENRYEMILEAEAQGMLIPAEHAAFARYFEQTPKYTDLAHYFDEFRMKLALMYARPAQAEARS